jgi:sulfopyruvate decarboxylase TPP-binding subunit
MLQEKNKIGSTPKHSITIYQTATMQNGGLGNPVHMTCSQTATFPVFIQHVPLPYKYPKQSIAFQISCISIKEVN